MDLNTLFGKRSPGSESEGSLPTSSTAPRSSPSAYSTSAPNSRGEWPADGGTPGTTGTMVSAVSRATSTTPPLSRNPSFFDDRGLPPRPGYVPLTRKKAGKGRRRLRRGGYDLRSSTLKKRAEVEARIKAKEEEASKRREAEMTKKLIESDKSSAELMMESAQHASESNRLMAEAARLREFAQRVRDTPKELDELTALMDRMGMGGRRTKKTRRATRRIMKSRRRRV